MSFAYEVRSKELEAETPQASILTGAALWAGLCIGDYAQAIQPVPLCRSP